MSFGKQTRHGEQILLICQLYFIILLIRKEKRDILSLFGYVWCPFIICLGIAIAYWIWTLIIGPHIFCIDNIIFLEGCAMVLLRHHWELDRGKRVPAAKFHREIEIHFQLGDKMTITYFLHILVIHFPSQTFWWYPLVEYTLASKQKLLTLFDRKYET